jgi:hypothetical protein
MGACLRLGRAGLEQRGGLAACGACGARKNGRAAPPRCVSPAACHPLRVTRCVSPAARPPPPARARLCASLNRQVQFVPTLQPQEHTKHDRYLVRATTQPWRRGRLRRGPAALAVWGACSGALCAAAPPGAGEPAAPSHLPPAPPLLPSLTLLPTPRQAAWRDAEGEWAYPHKAISSAALPCCARLNTPTPQNTPTPTPQAAWRDAEGEWEYPHKGVSSERETLSWEALRGMLQERFIDHPKLPSDLRHLVLPLQEVRGVWVLCLGGGAAGLRS